MPEKEKMTIDERWKYLRIMRERYRKADRKGRTELLNEMAQTTGMHRKSLLRRLNGRLTRKARRRQRGRTYGPEVDDAVRVIAESLDYICAERLQPDLVKMAQHLAKFGELEASPALLEQLARVSISTVRRIVKRIRQDERRLPRKGPRRANRVTKGVPEKRIPWDMEEPGHFEVDLVHHGGPRSSGEYVHTLQMIDVATGWSERVAVLGRSARAMEDGFRRLLARLPFPILEIHPDNGSEFLNHHLVRFWKEIVKDVHLSRSRPYQKNDNRFVEQKNYTLVREYFGNERLDTVGQTIALNNLYDKMWLYYNFFQPVMRLTEKTIVTRNDGTTRVKRRHDQARTPFDRLCATATIWPSDRELLEQLWDQTNPRQLRKEINHTIDDIFRLPNAVPGHTEDVHLTFTTSPLSRKGGGIPVALSFDRTTSVR